MTPLELEQRLWREWCLRYGATWSSAYEKKARKAYAGRATKVSAATLARRASKTKLIAFGDDRLVRGDQEKITTWVETWWKGRAWTLITDRIPSRRQKDVDRVLAGQAPMEPFLKQLGKGTSDGVTAADGVEPIFRWLKKRKRKAIVCGAANRSAERGDIVLTHAAKTHLAQGKNVVLWTGALRLAPNMLPQRMEKEKISGCFVSLQAPNTRWHSGRITGWASLRLGVFAWLDRSPLLGVEMFRSENRANLVDPGILRDEFARILSKIAARVGKRSPAMPKKLLSPFEIKSLQYLLENDGKRDRNQFLLVRLARGESAVVPREGIVLLSTLDRGHLAEEAAHFLRLSGVSKLPDGMYGIAVEEAFAFLASTWIDPTRTIPESDGNGMDDWERIHRMGYSLGALLAQRCRESKRACQAIARLWTFVPKDETGAQELYQTLTRLAR